MSTFREAIKLVVKSLKDTSPNFEVFLIWLSSTVISLILLPFCFLPFIIAKLCIILFLIFMLVSVSVPAFWILVALFNLLDGASLIENLEKAYNKFFNKD